MRPLCFTAAVAAMAARPRQALDRGLREGEADARAARGAAIGARGRGLLPECRRAEAHAAGAPGRRARASRSGACGRRRARRRRAGPGRRRRPGSPRPCPPGRRPGRCRAARAGRRRRRAAGPAGRAAPGSSGRRRKRAAPRHTRARRGPAEVDGTEACRPRYGGSGRPALAGRPDVGPSLSLDPPIIR